MGEMCTLLSALLVTVIIQRCGPRPSVLGQDRSQTKHFGRGRGLAGLVFCCETPCCYARASSSEMILKDTATFQVPFIVSHSILCLEHHSTVEINSYLL